MGNTPGAPITPQGQVHGNFGPPQSYNNHNHDPHAAQYHHQQQYEQQNTHQLQQHGGYTGQSQNFNNKSSSYGGAQSHHSNYYPEQNPSRQIPHPSARSMGKQISQRAFDVPDEEEEEEVDAIEVLFQFIPYYGQGDSSTDSMVRSTLSALSVDDIDQKDSYGNTLLLLACQYSLEDLVRIMINKGADPNATDSSGASCLHYPCYKETKNKNIAKLLLQNGANPEVAETTYGCTPLHYAAGTGDVDFCKMLINYGSQVGTYDYYNYTCVDYAREARKIEAASFLQKKLLQTLGSQGSSNSMRDGSKNTGGVANSNLIFGKNESISLPGKSFTMVNGIRGESFSKNIVDVSSSEWAPHLDPATGDKYYMNQSNGECLWEQDYLDMKAAGEKKKQDHFDSELDVLGVQRVDSFVNIGAAIKDLKLEDGKSSPRSKEDKLEISSPKSKDTKLEKKTSHSKSMMNTPSVDAFAMQKLLQEAKMQADEEMSKERQEHSLVLADKDGKISKLESANSAYSREKTRLENELSDIRKRLEITAMSGGEAMKKTEELILKLEKDNTKLKEDLLQTTSQLENELEKLKSLESTLGNLESGHVERIEQERRAAEERSLAQKQREQEHFLTVKELESKMAEMKAKLQEEISKLKAEIVRIQREADDRIDVYKKQRDKEIEQFNAEMSEKSAKFAVDLSNALSEAENNKKRYLAAEDRALIVEEQLKLCQKEIEEAREVHKYNAQLHKDLAREQKARKRLHNEIEDMKGRIRVYVRIRPFSNSEKARNCTEAVSKDGKLSVVLNGLQGDGSKKAFDFDQVFGGSDSDGNSQVDIFKDTKHLMLSVIDGYNVCIFAYGQTGSGKTFTMIGAADIGNCLKENGDFDELAGITPRAVSELFRLLKEREAQVQYEVEVQMFQLYRDGLEDLLSKAKGKQKAGDPSKPNSGTLKITLAEHSPTGLVNVEGANTMIATSPADVMKIFEEGASRRTTASTQMNAESSRSHLICSLVVKLTNRRTNVTAFGKLTLVDLAGSERVDKSGAEGEMLKEAQSINKSLSALGDVIASLTSGGAHTPYRNHPLTMLMSDSIGGDSKTLMFVNCSPADYNVAESNSSLQFASRCKDVVNATSAPPAVQAAQLNALKKELAKLKKGGAGGKGNKLSRPV